MTSSQKDSVMAGDVDSEQVKQVTVRLSKDLHRRFKLEAFKRGENMGALLAGWVERWTSEQEAKESHEPLPARVESAPPSDVIRTPDDAVRALQSLPAREAKTDFK